MSQPKAPSFTQHLSSNRAISIISSYLTERRRRKNEKEALDYLRGLPDYVIKDTGVDFETFAKPPKQSSVVLPHLWALQALSQYFSRGTL